MSCHNICADIGILSRTRLFTMRSKPDYVEFVVVIAVLIVVAVHKGLVVINKSLSDTH